MIVTDPLKARTTVDVGRSLAPGAMEAVLERLAREIIRTGESAGAFIRRESIWFRKVNSNPNRNTFDVEASWAPDPNAGVILRGGPNDGGELALDREDDGTPREAVVLPPPESAPEFDGVPEVSRNAMYARVGIDSEKDAWVYEYRR